MTEGRRGPKNTEEELMEMEELNEETIDLEKIVRCKKCELSKIEDDDELKKDNLINIQTMNARKKKEMNKQE